MRALASRLDTSVASLYAHVDGKAELYRLALDRLFGKLEVPPPDPPRWRDQVREVVREARDLMGRHPDLAGMMLGHVMGGPNFVSFLERLLALLRAGGLPERVCVCGRELLGLLIGTYAVEDGLAPCGRDTEALLDYLGSLPGSRFPNTVALAGTRRRMRLEERFELGLDVILSGLASHAAARR
jgi:TetR/AcrR family tetracycline transcriptional repressor